jgi:DnaJ-class molecular chaperone
MCRGTGRLVFDAGSSWNDDPNFDETCEECSGSGIEVECDYCRDQRDVDSDGVCPS